MTNCKDMPKNGTPLIMKTIKLGYEGDKVAFLCQALVRGGYQVAESRVFTKEVKDAVIDCQKKY